LAQTKTKNSLPKEIQSAFEVITSEFRRGEFATNLPSAAIPLAAYFNYQKSPERVLYVVPDDNTALECYRALRALLLFTEEKFALGTLVSWGVIPYSFAEADKEKEYLRTQAERLIISQKPCLIFASAEGVSEYIADEETASHSLRVKAGGTLIREKLVEFLLNSGYVHAEPPPVTKPGEFCVKGSVVDIFPPDLMYAIRLDYFGDEVETIKGFSHETQRSFLSLPEIELCALRPNISSLKEDIEKLATKILRDNFSLPPILETKGNNRAGYADIYPELRKTSSIAEYWKSSQGTSVFVVESEKVFQRLETLSQERTYLYEKSGEKFRLSPEKLFVTKESLNNFFAGAKIIPPYDAKKEEGVFKEAQHFGGRLGRLKDTLQDTPHKPIYFVIESEGQRDRLTSALSGVHTPHFLPFFYPSGVVHENFSFYTERDVFGRVVTKFAGDKKISRILESYTDLKEGDYIVHVNYGIGRFSKLCRMKVVGTSSGSLRSNGERIQVERDFLELVFQDGDKLFVPLDQLHLVHKYIGQAENPRLDYLGKKSTWAKTRARIKRLIDSIAEELLELYALRQQQKGFAFPPDSSFQHDFEAAFPFTETEHQLEAIYAIKRDMESEKAMDRLVCGDVGFGKTEVAIRAAFKAAMAGKQVAILCPTTILAFQHFRSFTKRFADYPVTIDFLSRFRTPSESRDIKNKIAEGKIDIIIGTHSLFANDIKYKSLGLLIIDEEQRFGVEHKEKLRQMKYNLDSLALTATPIPRTLHMSLAGIRDLSIIETPPAERRKIETHVLKENEEFLRLALKRELERGGQAYVLHNKVKTIDAQAARIHALVPSARIAVLHGQMPENEIEEVMVDFYQHAYDILVSTTIIESGIDIPNCNTLAVLSAHEFGLSQLYQLKGRVGRSEKQAFAYFFYPVDKGALVNSDAQRRLEVLAEYDDLGSGFKIALKDLEIRGAGNLLGREQSGEIMEIGFELYSRMLSEKLEELKGKIQEEEFISTITLPCDWYFPDEYIRDTREKMEFYKAFSSAQTLDEFHLVSESLFDRFGAAPDLVERMLVYEEIRLIANLLRIEKIELGGSLENERDGVHLIVAANHRLDMARVTALLTRDKRVSLDKSDVKRINLDIKREPQIAFFRELKALLISLGVPSDR